MFKPLAASLTGAAMLAAGAFAAAPKHQSMPPKLIYKVDSIIATLAHGRLFIQAKGAVRSGGWKAATLKLVRSPADPHTIVIDFLATPPPAGAPVIQGLLPISASMTVPMRRGVVTVRAVSDANEMTTQILK